MTWGAFVLMYVLAGLGVAGALLLARPRRAGWFFAVLTAPLFWPIYLPILLSRPTAGGESGAATPRPAHTGDAMEAAILDIERELAAALRSRDGWAEEVR